MSLQGAGYGIECTAIRQSLQDIREPMFSGRYPERFYKYSQFQTIEPEIHFSTSPSLNSSESHIKNNLHKLYNRLKLFSRRDNKNKPAKDRSNRVFPNKTFRVKFDTVDEITKTRWHVWNTFTRKMRVFSPVSSLLSTPSDYTNNSLNYTPAPPAVNRPIDLDQMFQSLDPRAEFKSPNTSAGFT